MAMENLPFVDYFPIKHPIIVNLSLPPLTRGYMMTPLETSMGFARHVSLIHFPGTNTGFLIGVLWESWRIT